MSAHGGGQHEQWALVFRDTGLPVPKEIVTDGQFLCDYDLDFNEGRGLTSWTSDPVHAMRWASFADAINAWRTVCPSVPVRPDGMPNRPLTAFSVEPMKL